jgi:uncharacterized membrane protein
MLAGTSGAVVGSASGAVVGAVVGSAVGAAVGVPHAANTMLRTRMTAKILNFLLIFSPLI